MLQYATQDRAGFHESGNSITKVKLMILPAVLYNAT